MTLSGCKMYSSATEAANNQFTEVCYDGIIYLYNSAGGYGQSMTVKIDKNTLKPIKCQ